MAKTLPYPKIGDKVLVVQKIDYPTGKLTEGVVKDILTSKRDHPRGTKVRLTTGIIGRIQGFADHPEWGQLEQKETSDRKEEEPLKTVDTQYFEDPDALV